MFSFTGTVRASLQERVKRFDRYAMSDARDRGCMLEPFDAEAYRSRLFYTPDVAGLRAAYLQEVEREGFYEGANGYRYGAEGSIFAFNDAEALKAYAVGYSRGSHTK